MTRRARCTLVAGVVLLVGSLLCSAAAAQTPLFPSQLVAQTPALQAAMAQNPGGTLSVGEMTVASKGSSVGSVEPDNKVTGDCGSVWLYISPGADHGTITESAGIDLDYAWAYGGGSIAWLNESTGKSNAWDFTLGPNLSGNWSVTREASTGSGTIYADLNAAVYTVIGVCQTDGTVYSVSNARN